MHRFLVKAEVNAYLFWWLFAKPKKGGKQMLLRFDDEKKTYKVLPQAWTFGNYSRFVRPGYRRVATDPASGTVEGLMITAFKAPAGDRLVVVVINPTKDERSLALSLDGVAAAELLPHRSGGEDRLKALPAVPVADGSATVRLPAESVTTYVAAVPAD